MRPVYRWPIAVLLGAVIVWLLWPKLTGAPESTGSPSDPGATTSAGPGSLAAAPGDRRGEPSGPTAVPPTPGADGLVPCEIRVTTFGDPGRDVEIVRVWRAEVVELALGVARVRVKPGSFLGMDLRNSAASNVRVDVPDPVRPRIDVRVPALDDPRLEEPVLLVVDDVTGLPLPKALFDPGATAPETRAIPADAEGRIRIPRALAQRVREHPMLTQGAIISENDHLPRTWRSLVGRGEWTLPDWAEWDATGAMRVRLEPHPAGARMPRRWLRIADENGVAVEGRLILMRTPGLEALMRSPFPARTDATGLVEVVAPQVAAYDIWDGSALLGTFVLALGSRPEEERRAIQVPSPVSVHVIVRGLPEPRPAIWLRGPDVASLEPDEKTGWARVGGEVVPGWRAFPRSEGTRIEVPDGLPVQFDVRIPPKRGVPLWIGDRALVLFADEPMTVDVDWMTLEPPKAEPIEHGWTWSLTREGLDEQGAGPPKTKAAGPGK